MCVLMMFNRKPSFTMKVIERERRKRRAGEREEGNREGGKGGAGVDPDIHKGGGTGNQCTLSALTRGVWGHAPLGNF